MDATALILLLWIAFAASHIGLASVRVEPRLRAALGGRGFLALYSAISLALFIPLVSIYFGNRHAGETTLWWITVGPRPARSALRADGAGIAAGGGGGAAPQPRHAGSRPRAGRGAA